MNKFLGVIALGLMSTLASAQVTIQTDNRVDILAVNQEINTTPKKAKGDLKIENGVNQLLIRVTAMVDGNGGKKKFNSLPMVVKFEANNQTLKFETPFAIRDERGVRKFEKQPTVKVTSNGNDVPVEIELVYDQTFALIKDYDEMLEQYNLAGGVAAINVVEPAIQPTSDQRQSANKTQSSSAVSKGIQGEFLQMTPAQRQEFISWAVKHIND
ncbi:DUF2057 domain-containing protein [Vibrio sp. RE86]|uniref:DUF2057 family protein n=1 Tax=Vibrio sp. RE86 TaxID=2607605 RepID=UPI0014939CC3|nr:DUF2057 family protein [Vibrio sp. RE86]NOH81324.1 DUF2057 domain-containing protein [Vibrio sp. RE86]